MRGWSSGRWAARRKPDDGEREWMGAVQSDVGGDDTSLSPTGPPLPLRRESLRGQSFFPVLSSTPPPSPAAGTRSTASTFASSNGIAIWIFRRCRHEAWWYFWTVRVTLMIASV